MHGKLHDDALPNRRHQGLVSNLLRALGDYIAKCGDSFKAYGSPFAVNLNADDKTYVEPDVLVICDPSKLTDFGCKGAPDFVAEVVSPSSRSMDYVKKTALYLEAGVREYWIVDPARSMTTVYHFGDEGREDCYAPIIYPFNVAVPVGIYNGQLEIIVADLLD